MQSIQLHWCRDDGSRTSARTPPGDLGRNSQPGGQPCKLGQISSPYQGHHHLPAPRLEEEAVEIEGQAEQGKWLQLEWYPECSKFVKLEPDA